jgi:hypothetical protein
MSRVDPQHLHQSVESRDSRVESVPPSSVRNKPRDEGVIFRFWLASGNWQLAIQRIMSDQIRSDLVQPDIAYRLVTATSHADSEVALLYFVVFS